MGSDLREIVCVLVGPGGLFIGAIFMWLEVTFVIISCPHVGMAFTGILLSFVVATQPDITT